MVEVVKSKARCEIDMAPALQTETASQFCNANFNWR